MNALGFVFFVLSILSIGAFVSLEKQIGAIRLRSSSLGHIHANREILNQCESKHYKSLKSKASPSKKEKLKGTKQTQIKPPPPINPECARLNLLPLIQNGFQKETLIYHTAAKLLQAFYGDTLFEKKAKVEYQFLDAFLKAGKKLLAEQDAPSLEKIAFQNKDFQRLYYKMLKGTKGNVSYPSLIDFFKLDSNTNSLCICHAHPRMLSALFSPKAAIALYNAVHTPGAPAPNKENIERICLDAHLLLDPEIFDLLDLQAPVHPELKKAMLIGEDPETRISLKKTIFLPAKKS